MKDKDKIYLVYYVGVGVINRSKICGVLNEIYEYLSNKFDDTVNILVVPVQSNESRIDILNLDRISDEALTEKVKSLASQLATAVEELTQSKSENA